MDAYISAWEKKQHLYTSIVRHHNTCRISIGDTILLFVAVEKTSHCVAIRNLKYPLYIYYVPCDGATYLIPCLNTNIYVNLRKKLPLDSSWCYIKKQPSFYPRKWCSMVKQYYTSFFSFLRIYINLDSGEFYLRDVYKGKNELFKDVYLYWDGSDSALFETCQQKNQVNVDGSDVSFDISGTRYALRVEKEYLTVPHAFCVPDASFVNK